jgi:hypothetical protein
VLSKQKGKVGGGQGVNCDENGLLLVVFSALLALLVAVAEGEDKVALALEEVVFAWLSR